MSWNHIVIEGYCMYTDEEAHADKNINLNINLNSNNQYAKTNLERVKKY